VAKGAKGDIEDEDEEADSTEQLAFRPKAMMATQPQGETRSSSSVRSINEVPKVV